MKTMFIVGAALMLSGAMLFGFSKGDEDKKKLAKFLFFAGVGIGFAALVLT
jgi:hypothetical protein